MNDITTISDHVLLPHQADWSRTPELVRLWRAAVESAMTGQEDRLSARSSAWMRLTYSVLPYNHVERARFDVRMREGLKAGKLAVPLWGRGVALADTALAGHASIVLVRSNHGIESGKYLLIQPSIPAQYDTWDLCLVTAVAGTRLTLAAGLTNGYAIGTRAWPLLFGRPIPQQFTVRNASRAKYEVSVQFDGRQINAFAYDNFEDYPLGDVTAELNGGEGWSGAWVIGTMAA
jgi:hypothetical protein